MKKILIIVLISLVILLICGFYKYNKYRNFVYWGNRGLKETNATKQIECFTNAIRRWQNSDGYNNKAVAYYNLGNGYFAQGEYEKAIVFYGKTIELNPGLTAAYYNRGLAYTKKGDYARSIIDYNKTIELNPKHVGAYYNRGLFYFEKSDYKKAMSNFIKAQEINSKLWNVLIGIAFVNMKQTNFVKAKYYFKQAKELQSLLNNTSGLFELEKRGYFYTSKQKDTIKDLRYLKD
ncbi:MAG: tetratricopeptide repeat protein [Elusimicrobia bacterium]|nr:tetratricopeptide repeat protein [Elusimicrobiota bacterium]